jgi:hypothetical protein
VYYIDYSAFNVLLPEIQPDYDVQQQLEQQQQQQVVSLFNNAQQTQSLLLWPTALAFNNQSSDLIVVCGVAHSSLFR